MAIFRTKAGERAQFATSYQVQLGYRQVTHHNKGNPFKALLDTLQPEQLTAKTVRALVSQELLGGEDLDEKPNKKMLSRLDDYNRSRTRHQDGGPPSGDGRHPIKEGQRNKNQKIGHGNEEVEGCGSPSLNLNLPFPYSKRAFIRI